MGHIGKSKLLSRLFLRDDTHSRDHRLGTFFAVRHHEVWVFGWGDAF